MYLEGKVQTARFGNFHDLEVVVSDHQVIKPMGGRPQYACKIVRGWPGLEELRALKKRKATVEELDEYTAQIPLPQEDEILVLTVVDMAGKGSYRTLLCEVMAQS